MTYQIFEIKYFKAQTTFFNHSGQYSQNALLKKKGERMSGWTMYETILLVLDKQET